MSLTVPTEETSSGPDYPPKYSPHTQRVRKVLHVMNGEVYGGAERALDLLALHLGRYGFDAGFACIKPALFPKVRHARQAPLYEVPMRHRADLRPVAQLVRIIRREGYSLVYAHTARSAMVATLASKIAGVPLVYHVQSPTSRDTTHRWKNAINAVVERLSLTRASALMAVSESLAEHVRRQGFPEEMISVVPNGVPCREPVPPRSAAKAEWTLGTVALLRPRKGVDILLRALAILRSQGLPVRLRAAGPFETPQYERQMKRLTQQLGLGAVVEWTGFTRDVDAELARMDVFVLPSLFGEGLPLVVLEAMAAGVPVVASRVEGTPEAIRDGRDGLIVQPGDPHDLAAALKRVISGQVDWHALRASALRRHAECFSDLNMAAGVARVYRRVLGEGR
jgi:glycosyltransferase involved in cell wall biosynthesis